MCYISLDQCDFRWKILIFKYFKARLYRLVQIQCLWLAKGAFTYALYGSHGKLFFFFVCVCVCVYFCEREHH